MTGFPPPAARVLAALPADVREQGVWAARPDGLELITWIGDPDYRPSCGCCARVENGGLALEPDDGSEPFLICPACRRGGDA
jgi:hypothetical protein